jgi:malonyl-CoA reductase/3-hydroxypropionate dehydrogenase (NADP+)
MNGQNLSWARPLRDLHLDKVALVTGGSGGIGAEVGRVLALSGAKVMLAARREEELKEVKARIVAELEQAGYPDPAGRLHYMANCDISNPAQVEALAAQTLEIFGQVDYIINNAAVTGGEAMVIDLPLQTWRETLQANLISNYALIRHLAPQMKARGGGYIINVSSYFGGEKNMAIAYPNRADYGLSKAGQRALVENFARFLGPEIQINASAPGPVDGERLRGSSTRSSMFERRARVILENKRLNDIYTALIRLNQSGLAVEELLASVLVNEVEAVLDDPRQPEGLRRLARTIRDQSDPAGSSRNYFLNPFLANRLVQRFEKGGYLRLPQDLVQHENIGSPAGEKLLGKLPPEPFFSSREFEREARRIQERNLSMLYLKRMPTNLDLAITMAYHLTDRFVTGETFHSSGGLKMERAVSEGELFGHPNPQRLEQLKGSTIFIFGEFLQQHMSRLAQAYLEKLEVARLVFLTETEAAAAKLLDSFPSRHDRVAALVAGEQLEEGFDRACRLYGKPGAVISTPFRPLPHCRLSGTSNGDWSKVLSAAGFADLIEEQITHHFRVAQRASFIDNARIVLITPPTGASSSDEEFTLANFIKTTLHAFTATLGAESERTVHHSAVNQVDLTRRARDEEPRNHTEEEEELVRFVNAVLLTTTPLPGPSESRYRSRIYRGNAITV